MLTVKDFIGEKPFALLLADDIIQNQVPVMKQLIEVFDQYQCGVLAIEEVAAEKIASYGINKSQRLDENSYEVLGLVGKPEVRYTPMGIVGRYVLTPEMFEALWETPPGQGGKIQLTNGLNTVPAIQNIIGYRFEGTRYDVGRPLDLLKASIAVALEDPVITVELRGYLTELKLFISPRAQPVWKNG